MCDFTVLPEGQQDRLGPDPQSAYRLGYRDQLPHKRTDFIQGSRKVKRRGQQLWEVYVSLGWGARVDLRDTYTRVGTKFQPTVD